MGKEERATAVVGDVLDRYPYWSVTIDYDREDRVFEAMVYDREERIYRAYEVGSTIEDALIRLGQQMLEDDVLPQSVLNADGVGESEGEEPVVGY